MLTVNIGPLAMASSHLILLISLFLATLTGWWLGRHRQRNPEKHLFNLLLLGLVVARLAFVTVYFDHFRDSPWRVIDIRDGGFIIWPGIIAALLAGLWLAWRDLTLRLPLGTALAVGLIFWAVSSYMLQALQQGTQLPDMTLLDVEGEQVSLQELNDRPLVVNLWATWCPPCRREMPVLADAQQREADIVFVFVNQGEGPGEIIRFLDATGLTLHNVLLDTGGQFGQQVGSQALPTTLFYNAQGQQVASHLGELSAASLSHQIAKLKEEETP
ncbi:TlpA family protein disulfide reductase [Halopseudomonas pelagia]|uniref:TlpA family protein disulfide reductase n=1 Tax=Halopseudomonas pelagia TaxID=553151 RepID=UPI0003A2A2F3|nr:TlpA disulfide reductase family protein [Halopseudomonas pelagia]